MTSTETNNNKLSICWDWGKGNSHPSWPELVLKADKSKKWWNESFVRGENDDYKIELEKPHSKLALCGVYGGWEV